VFGGECPHRSRVVEVAAKWPLAVDGLASGKCGADELPHSRDTVVRLSKGLDDNTITRVFRTNAAELFHFSDDILTTPV
jgi:hypothetical protein